MKQVKLIGSADLEKLNMNELTHVGGGVNVTSNSIIDPTEESQHDDSNNNDHFKEREN